jgi:membrane fusion protein (multidrug efflux system)
MIRRRAVLLRFGLLVGVPVLVVFAVAAIWLRSGRTVGTENAYVKADIAQISSDVSGRVVTVRVRDQQTVHAGDIMIELDPQRFLIALSKADAELDTARTAVETARATWAETQSELAELESQADYLHKQLERQRDLARHGVAPASKLDEAENDARVAKDRVAVVHRRLRRMLTFLKGNPEMPSGEHPLVREKQAERDQAALDLSHVKIVAPADGTSVNVRLQPGDQVKAATPLFVVVAETRPWIEANLKETDLTYVVPGEAAEVVLDMYPDEVWQGLVTSISPATGAEFAILPPQNASGNWVKVVQRLPVKIQLTPHAHEKPLRAGMTATVTISTGRHRSLGQLMSWIGGGGDAPALVAERR